MTAATLPRAFIWRRLHSLMGLWLVLFLIEHLLVNSQAALLFGENGKGFIEMVNKIHGLPFLKVIEFTLLGIPFAIHMVWGVQYLLTGKFNSHKAAPNKPSLPEYGRNHAYTWQRITSWILLIAIILHVAKFRFIDYPESVDVAGKKSYFVVVGLDPGLYTVSSRVGATLYNKQTIDAEKDRLDKQGISAALTNAVAEIKKETQEFLDAAKPQVYSEQKGMILSAAQEYEGKRKWVETLEKVPLKDTEVIAASDNFGTVSLLSVRDAFKSPIYVGFYTIFVLAACFHAFNGLWTFLITWGAILNYKSQKRMVKVAVAIMILVAFLGLSSVWGTYWFNLKS